MSVEAGGRVKKFLDERGRMQGIDHSEVAAVHRGDDKREAILRTDDLQALLADNERLRGSLSLLRVNSSLSSHQLEIISDALGA